MFLRHPESLEHSVLDQLSQSAPVVSLLARRIGEKFGAERVRDVPISEAAMIAAGVGAALGGMRPVVDLNFQDFAFGGMDELCNQAAKIPTEDVVPV